MKQSRASEIVRFMNRIYYNALTTTSGGNLSVIDPDGTVWISPSGIDKGKLTEDDIMRVKADGTIIGKHKPSIEYPFHRAIYNMRPDFKAILHAHPPMMVSFSVARTVPDARITPQYAACCGKVGFAPYAVPGSKLLGEKIAEEFRKNCDMVVMENHGVVLGADTMEHAFMKFEALDYAARTIYNARLIASEHTLSDAQIAAADRGEKWETFIPEPGSIPDADREAVAAFARRCCGQGLFIASRGTIAWKRPDGTILVTPENADRGELKGEEIVAVRAGRAECGKTPSRETARALRIFERVPEISTLYFAAPPCITAYGIAHEPFDPRVIPESYLVLRDAPGYDYSQSAEADAALSIRVPVVRIANDAVITSGRTLLEGFDRLEVLEYSARATIQALTLGGMQPMNEAQVAEIVEAFHLIP